MMHSPEDYYINPFVATFVRGIRWLALFAVLYSSAIYVSLVTFHPEMIPTELLFSIAASRETIPFPAVVEVLLMEGAFELIREAGLRVPTLVGPTIGIVGAVILGQAAVQARVVSPILVVVVALSGLSSFAIPNYDLGLAARLTRFLMIAMASILGIPGLTVMTMVLLIYVFSLRSFGVPITAPLVPAWPHAPDILGIGPVWMMRNRPGHLRPLDRERQPANARASVRFTRRRRTPGGEHK